MKELIKLPNHPDGIWIDFDSAKDLTEAQSALLDCMKNTPIPL